MKQTFYILLLVLATFSIGAGQAAFMHLKTTTPTTEAQESHAPNMNTQKAITWSDNDTLPKVRKTSFTTWADTTRGAIDLRDPENIKTEADYDDKTGGYYWGRKLGDDFLDTPFSMSWEEYQNLMMKHSIANYYRAKNAEEFKKHGKDKFDFTDMHFDLGPMNKVFGPGGVRIKTQGSAELKMVY